MRRRTLLASVPAALAAPAIGHANTFPSNDIRIISGAPPGGTSDLFCRLLAEKLQPHFRQRIIVENRGGAGGLVGAVAVASLAPDGHNVFATSMGVQAVMGQLPGQAMPIDPDRDLTPLSNGCGIPNMLIGSFRSPFATVPELIAHARANPGKLTYASAGSGGSQHLAAELFKMMTGTDILGITYRGGSPAVLAVVAGEVDLYFGNLPEVSGQVRQGGVRPMAIGSLEPSPLVPTAPVMASFVPGYEVVNWFGLAGPGNMDRTAMARWTEALLAIRDDPDFRRRMAENGMDVLLGTPEALRERIASDKRLWGDLIRTAGLRSE
jgi:tripartite-type tricarboxylate transporter receptor subunit TctC